MGAQLAAPKRRVVGLTGDGGFNMTLGELETARRAGTPFVLCVFNNAASGYVKALQHSMFGAGNYQSSDLVEMDYAAITRAMGCKGIRVDDPEKLCRRAARGAGEHRQPDRARHRGDARPGQNAARRRQPHARGEQGRPAGVSVGICRGRWPQPARLVSAISIRLTRAFCSSVREP